MPRARRSSSIALSAICEVVGGELHGDTRKRISSVAGLAEVGPDALSFVTSDKALKGRSQLSAGALLVPRYWPEISVPQIVVENPMFAFAQVVERFFKHGEPVRGIAKNLVKGTQVRIGPKASIWPNVTLGDRVRLGARVTLYPGVFVGSDSVIGDDTILHPNVVVHERCVIGARVVVHSGAVIGADGFRYFPYRGRQQKVPQLGGVTIEDDVELGANTTIDRATFGQTVVKRGAKVDNQVQIGHNAVIGEHSVLVAQVGVAGSATIGDFVVIGGQSGVADHIKVGDHVTVAAQTGINRSLEPNQTVSGAPVLRHDHSLRVQAVVPMLPELRQTIRSLKQRVAALEALATKGRGKQPKDKPRRSKTK